MIKNIHEINQFKIELDLLSDSDLIPILMGINDQFLTKIQNETKEFFIHQLVYDNFVILREAAQKKGFSLGIASAYRSYEHQLKIFNEKYLGLRPVMDFAGNFPLNHQMLSPDELIFAILRWSAIPGLSRHHWGTDFDLYDINAVSESSPLQLIPAEYDEGGSQHPFYQWLSDFIEKEDTGFFFPYKKDLGGVGVEKWHLSFQPVAEIYLDKLTLPLMRIMLEQYEMKLVGKEIILNHLEEIQKNFINNITFNESSLKKQN
jgi:LAS superfamily LD-carboxypeptidase LdcB